jgi:histidinol phosphatase-like enzyme (inositol monophosphatase family)
MNVNRGVLLEAVSELARLTGRIALEYFRPGVAAETKTDGSPVTQADRRAEQVARDWIVRRFPADGIVGEEFGSARPEARRRWFIDPIDGTASFIRHVPLWGSLIAVEEDGRVLAGAACYPAVEELVAAAVGQGCWRNGTRSTVSRVALMSAATVLTTDERFPSNEQRREAWRCLASRSSAARTWGDCYGYLMVATGRAEAMIDDVVSSWDAACMIPIVTEAGGVFTDFSGAATPHGGSAIATNAELAREIRSIMQDR